MIKCTKCEQQKQESDFNRVYKNQTGVCRDCHKAYCKEQYKLRRSKAQENSAYWEAEKQRSSDWYRDNRESEKTKRQQRRRLATEYVWRLKEQTPCKDCSRNFHPIAMDFDHLPGAYKVESVSRLISLGATIEAIETEIAKCELVCATCHRVRTYNRLPDTSRFHYSQPTQL